MTQDSKALLHYQLEIEEKEVQLVKQKKAMMKASLVAGVANMMTKQIIKDKHEIEEHELQEKEQLLQARSEILRLKAENQKLNASLGK